ncbi:MAG: type II toxin-antitoxin system YoeB family toxin [Verrucomicrobiota bacterium]
MEVIYKSKALDDIKFWKKSGQKTIQNKISGLIDDIIKHPYTGLGKPEALKYQLSGLVLASITFVYGRSASGRSTKY